MHKKILIPDIPAPTGRQNLAPGAGSAEPGVNAPQNDQSPEGATETFREFHNRMRTYRRRVFVRSDWNGQPIVRDKRPGEIKGKAAIKAAKRARVAELKRQQQEGSNG